MLPETRQKDARLAVKDEYTFRFLGIEDNHLEKELEHSLINNINKFLTEMRNYFTFVGSQYRLEGENPSIGIIVCQDRSKTKAELL